MARATFEAWITFRGEPDVLIEYEDGGYESDTNAHEIAWWFAEESMRDIEVTPEEEEATMALLYEQSNDRWRYGD